VTLRVQVSDTDVQPEVGDPLLDGDHERQSHIVRNPAKLTEAMVLGTPVEALCGKVWVPTRDPKRYPVCETCKEVYARLTGKPFG
jgi:hypothetical protein